MYGFVTRGLERSRTVFQPAGHEWRLHPTLRVTSQSSSNPKAMLECIYEDHNFLQKSQKAGRTSPSACRKCYFLPYRYRDFDKDYQPH